MPAQHITDAVRHALTEDIGGGDLTAALIPADQTRRARLITREAAVLCGTAWADEVFRQIDERVRIHWGARDGDWLQPDQTLCIIEGPARGILTGERTALNFVQT